MSGMQSPLILCMENAAGEDVALKIEPDDNFQLFLDKAKALLGYEVDINSITRNQPVSLTENVYQFLLNSEHNFQPDIGQHIDPMLEPTDDANDLVYILDDGTQIRASQIHFDNEDPLVDITAEKIPFVKYVDDVTDENEIDDVNIETKKINIAGSPVSRWTDKNSPKCFINSLPFKLICNNTSVFEAQFTKYLEANTKTYATLSTVQNRNKSPRSLIKENFKTYNESYQKNDNLKYTREDILNMFKDSPMTSTYDQGYSERRHVRKTDPSRLVHKSWCKPVSYVEIDGVLIRESESQTCFICGNHVDNRVDKLYLFDNEDQRLHRCSPQKKLSTQLKIICENCLNEYFKPSRMKNANQFLNSDEFLVIKNNQQYIFQKVKNFSVHFKPKPTDKIDEDEFVNVEIGSDGEIVTRPVDNDRMSDDVIIVKDEKKDSSSDVEIIEPEPEIDSIVDNLEDADEEVKEFLGKYECDGNIGELKCRFCEIIFKDLPEVMGHCETHKHDLEDGQVFPCPLCNYGYANLKWLKGHLKAAHDKNKKIETGDIKAEKLGTADDKTGAADDDKIEAVYSKTEAVGDKTEAVGDKTEAVSDKTENGSKNAEEEVTQSSPIAKRTRSSRRKSDGDKQDTEKNVSEEIKLESNNESTETRIIKTEVKQECLDSSEDEIWIVHTTDAEAPHDLEILLTGAKVNDSEENGSSIKCLNCSQIFPSMDAKNSHRCKKRGRKRKQKEDDDLICIPTQEDFIKRAQGRLRHVDNSADNNLLVARPRKKRNKKPTSDPQIVTCHNCNESFTSKVRLKFHMQFHESPSPLTADGRYSCAQCGGVTFDTETSLFDHVHFQHHKHRRWHCPVRGCGKTFYLRATLTKHSRTHTDTRRYACDTCGKRFLDKQTLDEHGVTHLQIKPFQCHICLKQLTRRSRLRMHVRAHEAGPAPALVRVCAVCARAFRDLADAQDHALKSAECLEAFASELKEEVEEVTVQLSPTSGIVRHTVQIAESPKLSKPVERQVPSPRGEPLLADMCDEARSIIRVVEIEKAFRCEYCEDVFYLENGLNTHRTIHKNVKNPFICHICKVSFATYSRCTTHKTTHGFYKRSLAEAKKQPSTENEAGHSATGILGYGDFPVVKHFLCENCGRSYLHWTYLQVHRRMKHATENLLYKCNQCDLTYPNSWSLAYHRKKLHGKTGADDPGATSKIPKEDYRIPCRDCDEVLPNKTALYKHRKKEHSDMSLCMNNMGDDIQTSRENSRDSQSDLTCASCNKSFASRAELQSHGRGACVRRPHACGVCARGFRTLSMRNEHMRTHTGERPFPCDVCGVAFRRSTAMRNHRLIHTGVRAWACARCPKRFRIRSELRTHLRLKHPATLVVIQMRGLDPSPEEVMNQLTINNIPHDKVIEITKMSFPKGSRSVIPGSQRALAALAHVARTHVAVASHPTTTPEEFTPARRGRGIAKNPRRPKILQRTDLPQDSASAYPITVSGEELSDINVQLLLRDGVLMEGNQMVQLQLDDSMLLE